MIPNHPISKAFYNPKSAGKYIYIRMQKKILEVRDRLWLKIASKIDRNTICRRLDGYEAQFRCSTMAEVEHYNINFQNERSILSHALSQATADDVFYDIGANTGLYACFVGQVAGETIAIEPQPENYQRLQENIELNNINSDSFELALSDSNTTTDLYVDPRGLKPGAGRSQLDQKQQDRQTVVIKTKTCTSLIADYNLPAPTIVKIDVEGAEMQVLNGMEDILTQSRCHTVYCEIHGSHSHQPESVCNYLESLGLNLRCISRGAQDLIIATSD
jgi:FkbM family methyltransferase